MSWFEVRCGCCVGYGDCLRGFLRVGFFLGTTGVSFLRRLCSALRGIFYGGGVLGFVVVGFFVTWLDSAWLWTALLYTAWVYAARFLTAWFL